MEYTIGNWTVKSLTKDTVTAPKNFSVPDLDYLTDYARTEDEPSEARLANVTGSSLVTPETIRYAKSEVKDVYTGTNIPVVSQHPVRAGVRTLAEVRLDILATNKVSGEEILIPLKGWTCLQIPTVNLVTDAAVEYILRRAVASTLNTSKVDASREVEIARGSLLPE